LDFKLCEKIITNISKVIVGKYDSLELLMVGMLADGHVLQHTHSGDCLRSGRHPGERIPYPMKRLRDALRPAFNSISGNNPPF